PPLPATAANAEGVALFPPQRYEPPPSRIADVTPLFQTRPLVQPPLPSRDAVAAAAPEPEPLPDLGDLQGRVIGQYRMSYIVIDMPGGLRLIDQHVAHERVLYDRHLAGIEAHRPPTQQLLTPLLYEAGAGEGAILESHADELRAAGFDIERFSGNTFAVAAAPPDLVRAGVEGFLRKLIDASLEERGSHVVRVREKICASLACQAAIKVHRPLTGEEMASLVSDLLQTSNPYACPHGRPIIVDIRHADIERHFHRR
ncbi:MAG TPA: hypothetical protein VNL91_05010, partial [Thermoanaerobaculia bacterium]|nr:hypothetical protein [Thermoanaerobaculia bacterium]